MITISKEDYLKAIAEAEAEGQTVIPATLAHWLSVTRPAVTFALKRLKKDGLVAVKKEGHISLTSQGREIAERNDDSSPSDRTNVVGDVRHGLVRDPRRGGTTGTCRVPCL
jgi:DNA-binding MarR family transcriptional regulator